ncbi:hypothetical protein CDAR_392171 [Caerostris darwini]|uniref:Uncharacterized protein n=1 Tax=Caerostris darwini TaxID=1538125 RepID=A0AAV4UGU8_9ARAC|nr:hypothetical protein CDAR_392171 [Caerostris darwini]
MKIPTLAPAKPQVAKGWWSCGKKMAKCTEKNACGINVSRLGKVGNAKRRMIAIIPLFKCDGSIGPQGDHVTADDPSGAVAVIPPHSSPPPP